LPSEYVATGVTLYTVINKEQPTDRPCYWGEVAGETFDAPETDVINSFKDFANPHVQTFYFNPANSFTFTNKGEQALIVVGVHYKVASGVENVTIFDNDDNAPVYNIYGQRVNENYRGYVIKNGQKYLQK
ncbi:MAG: hypothetical protein J1E63_06635, partial [Muribaculaceae bacterium]|nr:hypothetical protein [Muribaculaceae bacterium]